MKKNLTVGFHRSIASIFSVPVFRDIFHAGHSDYVIDKAIRYRSMLGARKQTKVKTLISKAFQHLSIGYRNEYVYKNQIADQLLLRLHDLREACLLNEFRVGGSIADIVIINGTNTIYEIKTELDSRDKLCKQIADYQCISPKVYVVTHHSLLDRYLDFLADGPVGLIALSDHNQLVVEREAQLKTDRLDVRCMMDTLRREEYAGLLTEAFGSVPAVSNILFYKECQKLAAQLDPKEFHSLMLKQLRQRSLNEKELICSEQTPLELKHICLTFNPNKTEFQNLYHFLNLYI